MKREWKPGDVAILFPPGIPPGIRGIRVNASNLCRGHQSGQHWHTTDGDYLGTLDDNRARPFVVIDPEDDEQVDRLVRLMCSTFSHRQVARDALRKFASPTPPRCPAVLHIGGERVECERDPGHLTDHRNDSIGQGVRWSA